MSSTPRLSAVACGVAAGAAGGLAEIAWVSLYASVTGGNAAALARGVTTAAGVNALFPASDVVVGVAVHIVLAVALGVILACVWRMITAKRPKLTSPYPLVLATLIAVWAVNFFVVLPLVSPAFVHMVPYAVSFTSKLLFGVAAAATLSWAGKAAAVGKGRAFARSR